MILLAVMLTTPSANQSKDEPKLWLESTAILNRDSKSKRAEIEVIFRNASPQGIRILNAFDSIMKKRSFFSVTLADSNGEMFGPYGGGSISLTSKDFTYVEVNELSELRVVLDVRDLLPKTNRLVPGLYRAQITYWNRYGTDCFRGKLESGYVEVLI